MKKTVFVWDGDFEVLLSKASKTSWIASGIYLGNIVTEADRSSGAALARWREAATILGRRQPGLVQL